MDFQPRLGVITRSLRLALPDLMHFALVAGAVFLGGWRRRCWCWCLNSSGGWRPSSSQKLVSLQLTGPHCDSEPQ